MPAVRAARATDLRLLALGRYSRAKGLEVVLRALAAVDDRVGLDVYGPALSDDERAHRAELEPLGRELALGDRVTLGGRRASLSDTRAASRVTTRS